MEKLLFNYGEAPKKEAPCLMFVSWWLCARDWLWTNTKCCKVVSYPMMCYFRLQWDVRLCNVFFIFFPFWTWPFDACFELDSPWIGGANIFGKTHIWREAVLYHHSCILKLLFIDWSCTHKRTYCSQLVSHVNSPTKFWARIVGSNGMFVIIFV